MCTLKTRVRVEIFKDEIDHIFMQIASQNDEIDMIFRQIASPYHHFEYQLGLGLGLGLLSNFETYKAISFDPRTRFTTSLPLFGHFLTC